MKPTLTFILALLISTISFAQQGINYKAVIKDGNGNVVANQTVSIQFTILEGATNVYQETHSPTTDANGIAIVNIGEGTSTDDFSLIDWGSEAHFLKVEVDINGGTDYVDMGITQFKVVPYAIQALKAGNTVFSRVGNVTSNASGDLENDNFVFGSNQLDYRNEDVVDIRMFFNKSKGAFRAGATFDIGNPFPENGLAWNNSNIGIYSFASGFNSVASGVYSTAIGRYSIASGSYSTALGNNSTALSNNSTAFGNSTTASGSYSTAFGSSTTASGTTSTAFGSSTTASGNFSVATGRQTTASGDHSIAMGRLTIASGENSTAIGLGTTAKSAFSTTIGIYNIDIDGDAFQWVATDPLFEIGNGSSINNKSNALTVLKNGNTGIGTATPDYKLSVKGTLNLNENISGEAVALKVNGAEALWYNGTYFSYGFGGSANFFDDNVGIGITNPNAKLDVNGNIEYTGSLIDVSDRRLKENFKPITNVLGQLQNIKGYTYNMKDDATKTREYGVIAQDVQKVFPEMVKIIDDEDHLGVSYIQLIPVLLEAIKEQQKIIDSQNKENVLQKAELSALTTNYKSLLSRIESLETNLSK